MRLQELQERIQIEIEVHQLLMSLARNTALLRHLGQLEQDFIRTGSLNVNALTAESCSHLDLPTGMQFYVNPDARELADIKVLICHKTWTIEITWHDEHGLIVRPIAGHRWRVISPHPSGGALATKLPADDCEG